jgi:membrane fusion protein (multidrug efflux system)
VGVVGLGWHNRAVETTDDAFVDGHIVSVAPQVAGRVQEVLVDDNQRVEANQILIRIDPADFQVKLDLAVAAQMQAEGQLSQARAQLPVVEAAAQQAAAQVKVARANAGKAAEDVQRYHRLNDEAVSKLVVTAAEAQEAVTVAQLDAATCTASGAKAQVEFARAAVTTGEANVAAAKAQVAQARLNLSYCDVKASAAGFVTRKTAERGNYIQVGQPVLNVVPEKVHVTANFKETQLTRMKPGQAVDIAVDTYPGVLFRGHVDSLMAGTGSAFALLPPENATGNYVKVVQRVPVKIVLDGEDTTHRLVPGMSVTPSVKVGEAAH